MDQIKIGKFIAQLRKEQDMTQLDLANKLGVTDRAVSKWENGRGLPDISLIQPLCETLDISINELLKGERIPAEQTLEIANQNIIGMLSDRKDETKKRKRTTIMCVMLIIITIVLGMVCSMKFGSQIVAQFRGDGYSLAAAHYTKKAEQVVKHIANGDYEKASKFIGFYTDDRDAAEKEWISAMEILSDAIRIELFNTPIMIENDRFVSGYTTMVAYDRESGKRFVFRIQICAQSGGVAFGSSKVSVEQGTREAEVAELIDDALYTWYPG